MYTFTPSNNLNIFTPMSYFFMYLIVHLQLVMGLGLSAETRAPKLPFFQTAKIVQGSLARSPFNKVSPLYPWGTRSGVGQDSLYNMILFSALSFYSSDLARSLCISMFFAPYFTFSTFFPLTTSLCLLTIYGKQKKMIFIELPTRHSSFQCKNKYSLSRCVEGLI